MQLWCTSCPSPLEGEGGEAKPRRMRGRSARHDVGVLAPAPLGPGAVVEDDVTGAGLLEGELEGGGGDAGAAGGDDRPVEVDAGGGELGLQRLGGFQLAILDEGIGGG